MLSETTEEKRENAIDETLAESFPASDPPAWTLGRDWHPQVEITPEVSQTSEKEPRGTTHSEDAVPTLTMLGIVGSLRRRFLNQSDSGRCP